MTARLLMISPEAPEARMAGPAIRYWQMAHALAAEFPVTLAIPGPAAQPAVGVALAQYDRETGAGLPSLLAQAEVVLCMGFALSRYAALQTATQPLVIDLYDPFILENLEIHAERPLAEQAAWHRMSQRALAGQLRRGDFFLCASERQRDFWLGALTALGRINPQTFGDDRAARRLIDVVPFGLPAQPPLRGRPVLKGVYPGIGADDPVIYWGGGVWEWFDPLTAIRAVAEVARQRPTVRLFFAGMRSPNPEVPPVRIAAAARQLSADLDLTGRTVFFNDWVPYAERADYLLEADVGLSLHFDQIETRFAFRTRLLDYIWAGLPMVVTGGEALGDLAAAAGLARTVAPGDAAGVAAALLAWLDHPGGRAAAAGAAQTLAEELRWARVVAPLAAFCREPRQAADRRQHSGPTPALAGLLLRQAWSSLRARGPAGLWRAVRLYLGR